MTFVRDFARVKKFGGFFFHIDSRAFFHGSFCESTALGPGLREHCSGFLFTSAEGCSALQGVAGCCRVLQCVAECCVVLQRVAVCCSVLLRVAVRCSVLQCVAV